MRTIQVRCCKWNKIVRHRVVFTSPLSSRGLLEQEADRLLPEVPEPVHWHMLHCSCGTAAAGEGMRQAGHRGHG